jgi:hypothetical protein
MNLPTTSTERGREDEFSSVVQQRERDKEEMIGRDWKKVKRKRSIMIYCASLQ